MHVCSILCNVISILISLKFIQVLTITKTLQRLKASKKQVALIMLIIALQFDVSTSFNM